MMKKLVILILVALVIGWFLFFNRPKPNILLVIVDTMREDLGGAKAPFFNSLKSAGIYFSNAYTTIPITLPAHLSLFTGKYPWQFHVINNAEKYTEEYKLLAQRLKDKGYHTYAVVSLGTLQGFLGVSRGFDYYDDNFPKTRWYRTSEEIDKAVKKILPKVKNPFFLWVHYSDPHEPYAPGWLKPDGEVWVNGKKAGDVCFLKKELFFIKGKPGEKVRIKVILKRRIKKGVIYRVEIPSLRGVIPFLKKREITFTLQIDERGKAVIKPSVILSTFWARFFYKREVNYWDDNFKKLFQELEKRGLLKNTYVFILADHGEGLGEWKNHKGHIHFLNGIYTRIPLLILTPDHKRGLRNEYRQIVDLFPTILHLAHAKVPEGIVGVDLLKNKRGHSRIFLETYAPEAFFDRFSILENGFQLIHTPAKKQYLFFNAEQDPRTIKPISFNEFTPKMMKELRAFEEEALSAIRYRPRKERRMLKILKSLGYVK